MLLCVLLAARPREHWHWNAFFQLLPAATPKPSVKDAPAGDVAADPLGASITDFVGKNTLSAEEEAGRNALLDEILSVAKDLVGENVSLGVYGSAGNGCGMRTSDVDVGILVAVDVMRKAFNSHEGEEALNKMLLRRVSIGAKQRNFTKVLTLLSARIPLLSLHKAGVDFDICLRELPQYNTKLLKEYTLCHPSVRPLAVMVKKCAKAAGLCGVNEGGWISSYSWTIMVIYYLQRIGVIPSLQELAKDEEPIYVEIDSKRPPFNSRFYTAEEASKVWTPPGEIPGLGDLFRGFFRFYGHTFEWDEGIVCIRLGRKVDLKEEEEEFSCKRVFGGPKAPHLHIEDPFEVHRNLNFPLSSERHVYLRSEFRRAAVALEGVTSIEDLKPSSSGGVSEAWRKPGKGRGRGTAGAGRGKGTTGAGRGRAGAGSKAPAGAGKGLGRGLGKKLPPAPSSTKANATADSPAPANGQKPPQGRAGRANGQKAASQVRGRGAAATGVGKGAADKPARPVLFPNFKATLSKSGAS